MLQNPSLRIPGALGVAPFPLWACCVTPAGGSLSVLPAQMAMPFRATEGLKPRVYVGGGHFPLFLSPRDCLSVKDPGETVLGAKTWARKDISFHRCKSFSFLPLSSPCPFSLSPASYLPLPHFTLSFSRGALLWGGVNSGLVQLPSLRCGWEKASAGSPQGGGG